MREGAPWDWCHVTIRSNVTSLRAATFGCGDQQGGTRGITSTRDAMEFVHQLVLETWVTQSWGSSGLSCHVASASQHQGSHLY